VKRELGSGPFHSDFLHVSRLTFHASRFTPHVFLAGVRRGYSAIRCKSVSLCVHPWLHLKTAVNAKTPRGNGARAANAATSTNAPGTIVARDASGNFSAGSITATNFTGGGAGLTNLSANAITGGLSINLAVLVPGGGTNILCFTNDILRAIQ